MPPRSLFLCLILWAGLASAADGRPNVIIVLADDLGYGDLGCYGSEKFQTPNIDEFAAGGVRFTDFYVPCPYCAPSRAALQTGRYPFRCGMTKNPLPIDDPAGSKRSDSVGLPVGEVTLGEVFQKAGYRTCCVGKWHLGHKPQFLPTRQGYDEYLGILYSNDMHRVELIDGEGVAEYPVVQATLTRRYTDRAIDFVRRNKDGPFFLYLPHAMPHKPLACSEAFYKKTGRGLYADVIAELDHEFGRLMAALKKLGLDENTLVVFASDNGPWYGGSTAGLRGMKAHCFEGGVRVPMMARWPGKIPARTVCREPAIIMDLFPTVLKQCGVAPPEGVYLDGRDIWQLMTRPAGKSPHEAILTMRGNRVCTARAGRWKLVVGRPGPRIKDWKPSDKWIDPRGPDGVRILAPYEQAHPSEFPGVKTGDAVTDIALFDLAADGAEQRNVASKHPEVVSRLRRRMAEIQRAGR